MPFTVSPLREFWLRHYPGHAKVLRYIASGSIAEVVGLVLLYALTDLLGIWYLLSSMLAFAIAFAVSFIFQKFWTFQDLGREKIFRQWWAYIGVAVLNLGFNTLLMYMFVQYAGFHYLVAQVVSSFLIAFESYFVYQHLIFDTPMRKIEGS